MATNAKCRMYVCLFSSANPSPRQKGKTMGSSPCNAATTKKHKKWQKGYLVLKRKREIMCKQ